MDELMWIWAEETGLPGRTLTLWLCSLPGTLVALMVGLHRLRVRVRPRCYWLSYLLPLGLIMTGLLLLWSPVTLRPGSPLRRTERVIRVARPSAGSRGAGGPERPAERQNTINGRRPHHEQNRRGVAGGRHPRPGP